MAPSRERTRSKLYTCYYSFGFTTKKKPEKDRDFTTVNGKLMRLDCDRIITEGSFTVGFREFFVFVFS